jgi:glycosyltransferase involved in cell wall biosynthesis
MNLLHLIPHIDKEAAGPSYSVPRLCQALASNGHKVQLACLAARGNIPQVDVNVYSEWPVLRRFAVSTTLPRAVREQSRSVDIVHNHSLWSMVNVAAGFAVPGLRARLVTSPRGTLSAWALSRRKTTKRLLWPLQRRVLARADLLHATSQVELTEIRAQGFFAPVAVIPNGIDLPDEDGQRQPDNPAGCTLLYLGRIHPIKGIDRLLECWAALERTHKDWRLVIAGPGEPSHLDAVRRQIQTLKLRRAELSGPLYGPEKRAAYRNADLFVLPTHSENFGMVVAEALAHSCPVVVSRGAPWSGIAHEQCGWWTSNEVDELGATLTHAMSSSLSSLRRMGENGRNWMQREYSWQAVAEKMENSYRWILGTASRPDCVVES